MTMIAYAFLQSAASEQRDGKKNLKTTTTAKHAGHQESEPYQRGPRDLQRIVASG
jgi:hypothetical protein